MLILGITEQFVLPVGRRGEEIKTVAYFFPLRNSWHSPILMVTIQSVEIKLFPLGKTHPYLFPINAGDRSRLSSHMTVSLKVKF